jgi:hypothetical protein
MEAAQGGLTEEIEAVARNERMDPEKVRRLVASGRVVIPHNPVHGAQACGIGEGLRVKVNVNLGTSRDIVNVDEELAKAKLAVRYGADAIMDLSTGGTSTPSADASSKRFRSRSAPSRSTRKGCGRPAAAPSSTWTRTTSSMASRSTPRTASTS